MSQSTWPAAPVRLLLLDVDGTLTDGGMYFSEAGLALKRFDVKDGLGLVRLQQAGVRVGIVSTDDSPITAARARQLGITILRTGCQDKAQAVREILAAEQIPPQQACFMGDDLTDLAAFAEVGHTAAPPEAVAQVREAAQYVTQAQAGRGAVREVCDLLGKACHLNAGRPATDLPPDGSTRRPAEGKAIARNRLNELSAKAWLLFQKSWFVHNPPPREADVLLHPAKFPESLCEEFISFFTQAGQLVLDPMCGTGSALLAAQRLGRRAVGVELSERYAEVARLRLAEEPDALPAEVICADARDLPTLGLEPVDYVLTSPPYWDMLRRAGFETQRQRRSSPDLDVHYSEDPADLGNVEDYEAFLAQLVDIYRSVAEVMRPRAYMTVIVKNVKKGGTVYPLAWDLGRRVGEFLALKDEKIWCQDNQRLAPYGMGYAWVSNTMHHYCLNFRKPA